jgi:hypothetical protein
MIERGVLRRDGAYLRTDDGQIWDYRGATMFMLLARFWRREDITPQIRWMQQAGVNVARVLVAGHPGLKEFDAFADAWTDGDFWPTHARFLERMANESLRVEHTVVSDESKDVKTWQTILQHTYDHCEGRWNAMVEWVNEPFSRAGRLVTMRALMNLPIERRGVLSAYGLEPERTRGGQFESCPTLDYVTVRTGRDRGTFAQNAKDLQDRRNVLGAPIVDDEPLGIGEAEEPGRRTTDEGAVAAHFAVARLFGAGATIHTQAGLEGRAPDPSKEPAQRRLGRVIATIWQFLPGNLQAGEDLSPEANDWPIEWSARDSAVNVACGKRIGDAAWIVNVRARSGWTVKPKAGWRVEAIGPYPWIAKLARR